MKILEISQKLVYQKFYLHEKILCTQNCCRKFIRNLLPEKWKKICKANNHDLNRDWKAKTGIIIDFISQGFINRSNHQHMFWKMLLIKCRRKTCEGVPFWKKIKTEINWIQGNSKHILIVFWNLQNIYLAKHPRFYTQKKLFIQYLKVH